MGSRKCMLIPPRTAYTWVYGSTTYGKSPYISIKYRLYRSRVTCTRSSQPSVIFILSRHSPLELVYITTRKYVPVNLPALNPRNARLMVSYFQYPLQKDINLRYFTPALICFGIIWIAMITLLNVAVVGYEPVAFTSTNYATNTTAWYEKFIPKFLSLLPRSCNATIIQQNEGYSSLFILAKERYGAVFSVVRRLQSHELYRWKR